MKKPIDVTHVVAIAEKSRVMGNSKTASKMPGWYLPKDMKHFKTLTEGHVVIMGKKTFESLPDGWRPLPNRKNIIITRDMKYQADPCNEDTYVAHSIEEAVILAEVLAEGAEIFVIGGAEIYQQTLSNPAVRVVKIIATLIDGEFEGDVLYPEIPDGYREVSVDPYPMEGKNTHDFIIVTYELAA